MAKYDEHISKSRESPPPSGGSSPPSQEWEQVYEATDETTWTRPANAKIDCAPPSSIESENQASWDAYWCEEYSQWYYTCAGEDDSKTQWEKVSACHSNILFYWLALPRVAEGLLFLPVFISWHSPIIIKARGGTH